MMKGEPQAAARLSEGCFAEVEKEQAMTIVQRMREQLRASMKGEGCGPDAIPPLVSWIAGLTLGTAGRW